MARYTIYTIVSLKIRCTVRKRIRIQIGEIRFTCSMYKLLKYC